MKKRRVRGNKQNMDFIVGCLLSELRGMGPQIVYCENWFVEVHIVLSFKDLDKRTHEGG